MQRAGRRLHQRQVQAAGAAMIWALVLWFCPVSFMDEETS